MFKILIYLSLFLSSFSISAQDNDYLQERLTLAADSSYEPYALYAIQIGLLEEHYRRRADSTLSIIEINEPLQNLSELYPLSIQANFAIAGFLEYIAKQSEDPSQSALVLELAKNKRGKAQSILDTILASGNGGSVDTAYIVINLAEEDAVLDHFGVTKVSQAVVESDDKYFDVLTTKDAAGQEASIFFDITLFYE